jgi:hypothetical protein
MTANSDQANGRFSIGGKVGEWVQGIDRTGAPVIYPLTVSGSPFKARAFVERSNGLSVLINWEPLEDHSKTRRAILELADAYGFTHDCTTELSFRGRLRGEKDSVPAASTLLQRSWACERSEH